MCMHSLSLSFSTNIHSILQLLWLSTHTKIYTRKLKDYESDEVMFKQLFYSARPQIQSIIYMNIWIFAAPPPNHTLEEEPSLPEKMSKCIEVSK